MKVEVKELNYKNIKKIIFTHNENIINEIKAILKQLNIPMIAENKKHKKILLTNDNIDKTLKQLIVENQNFVIYDGKKEYIKDKYKAIKSKDISYYLKVNIKSKKITLFINVIDYPLELFVKKVRDKEEIVIWKKTYNKWIIVLIILFTFHIFIKFNEKYYFQRDYLTKYNIKIIEPLETENKISFFINDNLYTLNSWYYNEDQFIEMKNKEYFETTNNDLEDIIKLCFPEFLQNEGAKRLINLVNASENIYAFFKNENNKALLIIDNTKMIIYELRNH